jgi:cell wall-associated NlpC family hydrolase
MRPGDLMFFYGSGGVYHAAIFVGYKHGRAMMVHAPGSGRRVTVAAPWTSSWFGGTLRH